MRFHRLTPDPLRTPAATVTCARRYCDLRLCRQAAVRALSAFRDKWGHQYKMYVPQVRPIHLPVSPGVGSPSICVGLGHRVSSRLPQALSTFEHTG